MAESSRLSNGEGRMVCYLAGFARAKRLVAVGIALAASLLLAPVVATPALAQGGQSSQGDDLNPQPKTTESKGGVETVFVTSARKEEERAIDTPVPLAALGEVQLARYNTVSLTDLNSQLPGVKINPGGGGNAGGNMSIRGVGNLAGDYGAEQPVAFVMDGFSFTRGHIIDVGFFDLADVEVLKGPQTQYFGKNSPAGVIAVTSKSPGDTFEGFARVGYEIRSEDPVVEFGVSIPVSDKFKFRIAGRGEFMQGGYIRNEGQPVIPNPPGLASQGGPSAGPSYGKYPKQHQYVGRATFVFTPSDNFDATLKVFASYSHQDDIQPLSLYACGAGPNGPTYLNALFSFIPDPNESCAPSSTHRFIDYSLLPPTAVSKADAAFNGGNPDSYYQYTRNVLTTLNMNYKIGDVTLTSVTGYWDEKQNEYTYYDSSSYGVVQSLQGESGHSFSEEFRARSHFDFPVNFMVGAFYEKSFRSLDAPVQIFPLGPAPALAGVPPAYVGTYLTYHQHWDNWIESWSIFGTLTWKILSNLEVEGAVRYTEDKRHSIGEQLFNRLDFVFGPGVVFAPTGTVARPTTSFHNTSPSVTVSWHPMPDMLVYAAYKTGFQAAGISNPGTFGAQFNNSTPQSVVESQLTFNGSTVRGFEGGIKGHFFDMLTADFDVFDYRYKNLQVVAYDSTTVSFITENAANSSAKGVEASLVLQASEELQLRAAVVYSYLKFGTFEGAACWAGQTPAQGCVGGVQSLSGQTYGGPPLSLSGGFTYDRPITDRWSASLTGDVIWYQQGRPNNGEPGTAIPAYALLNISARLYEPGGPWEFAVICSNCANQFYVNQIGDKSLAAAGDLVGYLGKPRLVTLQATYRW
ncbi:MAG: TonB-dependent receptor plug domain-containing protein [Alphaproteobacteria bacterium]|nr:TonB-dependent receptor plug domain-containing protein [Alphaproteobacteria bacterium]